MSNRVPQLNILSLYDRFRVPVTALDCGLKCAPHNPSGKPFCCDICQAVPAVYDQEWEFLRQNTDLWHAWRGNECNEEPVNPAVLQAETPEHMLLAACRGPAQCQREYRAISCRQFPFFPYISSDDRFIGLAYEWAFEPVCWVISNLGAVTQAYRREFIQGYDEILALWPDDHESYTNLSEDMRQHFASQKRRIPILHRNGGSYLLSPTSERLRRVDPDRFPRFGPY